MCEHFRWSSGLTTFGCLKRIVNKTSPSTACQVTARSYIHQKPLYHNISTTQKALYTPCKWTLDFLLSGKFSESVRKCFPNLPFGNMRETLPVCRFCFRSLPPRSHMFRPTHPTFASFFCQRQKVALRTLVWFLNILALKMWMCLSAPGFVTLAPVSSHSEARPIHFNTCYKIYSTFSRGNKARDAFAD